MTWRAASLTTGRVLRLGSALEIHVKGEKIRERHKFSGIDRLDSYIGSWKGFPWYCVIFSKDTECTNHITNWFDFRCCLGFGENNRSAVQNPNIVAIATIFGF